MSKVKVLNSNMTSPSQTCQRYLFTYSTISNVHIYLFNHFRSHRVEFEEDITYSTMSNVKSQRVKFQYDITYPTMSNVPIHLFNCQKLKGWIPIGPHTYSTMSNVPIQSFQLSKDMDLSSKRTSPIQTITMTINMTMTLTITKMLMQNNTKNGKWQRVKRVSQWM